MDGERWHGCETIDIVHFLFQTASQRCFVFFSTKVVDLHMDMSCGVKSYYIILMWTPWSYIYKTTNLGIRLVFGWLKRRRLSEGSHHVQISYLLPDTEEAIAGSQCVDNGKLPGLLVYTSSKGENLVF